MDSVELQQKYLTLFDSFRKISAELKKHDVLLELEISGKGLSKLSEIFAFNEDVYTFSKYMGSQFIKQTLDVEMLKQKIIEQERIIKTLEGKI